MTFADLGHPWSKFQYDYEEIRFHNYWGGLMDILAVNDMLNLGSTYKSGSITLDVADGSSGFRQTAA